MGEGYGAAPGWRQSRRLGDDHPAAMADGQTSAVRLVVGV
jgi:hypothetical protein